MVPTVAGQGHVNIYLVMAEGLDCAWTMLEFRFNNNTTVEGSSGSTRDVGFKLHRCVLELSSIYRLLNTFHWIISLFPCTASRFSMLSVSSRGSGTDFIFVASRILYAPFPPIILDEVWWYLSARLDDISSCCTAVPFTAHQVFSSFLRLRTSLVDHVLTVDFHIFLCTFEVYSNRIVC